jgi:ADP-ribose pyrophosphatase YjhB (NUDIX family)
MMMPAWLLPARPYRAIGGFVEFGERAAEAVVREFREELARDVEVLSLLGVREHIFDFGVASGHEVTFYFELRFASGQEPPDLSPLRLIEDHPRPDRREHQAQWVPVAGVRDGSIGVYPADLLEVLAPALRC